jgi:hypothetical protein
MAHGASAVNPRSGKCGERLQKFLGPSHLSRTQGSQRRIRRPEPTEREDHLILPWSGVFTLRAVPSYVGRGSYNAWANSREVRGADSGLWGAA